MPDISDSSGGSDEPSRDPPSLDSSRNRDERVVHRDMVKRLDSLEQSNLDLKAELQRLFDFLQAHTPSSPSPSPPPPDDPARETPTQPTSVINNPVFQPNPSPVSSFSLHPLASPEEQQQYFLAKKHFSCAGTKLSGLDRQQNYLFLHDWRTRVEYAVRAAGVDVDWIQVILASTMLEGEALSWYVALGEPPTSLSAFFDLVDARYQPVSAPRQAASDFESLKMVPGEHPEAFSGRLRRLAAIGELSEDVISFKFQSSLPPALRSALEQRLSTAGLVKPSFTQLVREAVEAFRLQALVKPTSSPLPRPATAAAAPLQAIVSLPSSDAKRTLPPDEELIRDLNITQEQLHARRARHLCFACGKGNHPYWRCRQQSKDQGQQSA
jgi:hypothetical protein